MRKVKKSVVTALMVCLLATGSLFAQQMAALININTADEATLATMEHVGNVRAQAIIQYRQENGPFKTVEDLKKVRGIGDKIFDGIKAKITVSDVQQ
jgi:competence protein ComEA